MASPYEVEVTISSAKKTKDVNWRHGLNRPYAVVWVEPMDKRTTKVDEEGDTKPTWNETFVIPLPPGPINDDTKLCIDLVHHGDDEGTRPLIGSAQLNVREVVEEVGMGQPATRKLKLKRASGRAQGKVKVEVGVREVNYERYEVEVRILSAKDTQNVNWRHGPNKPYAVVWVEPQDRRTTKVDEEGDKKPVWNETFVIPLPPRPIDDSTKLCVDLVHQGDEEGTKPLIGSARLSLKEVIEDIGIRQRVSRELELKRPSGRVHGKLNVTVEVREPSYTSRGVHYAPPYGHADAEPYHHVDRYAQPEGGYHQGAYHYQAQPEGGYHRGGYHYQAQPEGGYHRGGYHYQAQPEGGYYQGGYYNHAQPEGGYHQGGYYHPKEEEEEEKKKKSGFGGMATGLAIGAGVGLVGGVALAAGIHALNESNSEHSEAEGDAEEEVGDDE